MVRVDRTVRWIARWAKTLLWPASHSGEESGGAARLGSPLERVREPDQARFAPRPPEEREADRKLMDQPRRNGHVRISRHRHGESGPDGSLDRPLGENVVM